MKVFESAGVQIEWEIKLAGESALLEGLGSLLPKDTLDSIRRNKVAPLQLLLEKGSEV